MRTSLRRLAPLAALMLFATLTGAHWARAVDRPPTLDPTYGLPLAHPGTPTAQPTAQWIWADKTSDNQTIFLRRTFSLPAAPRTATLYVTADDFWTLFVNGKQIDQSQADPKDNNVWQHVHKVNVAPFLTAGRERLSPPGGQRGECGGRGGAAGNAGADAD